MSVVLIIDENSELIKKQFTPMKGIFCDTANTLNDAEVLLKSNQYDYVLVDFEIKDSSRKAFMQLCRASQPTSTFHYIVSYNNELPNGGLEDEVSIADSYLRRPIGYENMHDLVGGDNLVDQSDIDSLFG